MFSDLYYLSKLIDKSLSFSQLEKDNIFIYVKNNQFELRKFINLFEDEFKGLNFIKKDYLKSINKIWKGFKQDLFKQSEKEEINKIERGKDKIREINKIELKEKNSENIDSLLFKI